MTADVQRELAEALNRGQLEGALLPTVQALIADAEKRAAARALREAADSLANAPRVTSRGTSRPGHIVAVVATEWAIESIKDRADALDPT